jgi:hypothetical protein
MKTSLKAIGFVTLLSSLLLASALAIARDKSHADRNQEPNPDEQQAASTSHYGYLGVAIEPLHPSMWSHLRELFEREQGVLVTQVAEGSPAEVAGLQRDDILLTFDDQKIYSPDQLARLVRAEQPGHEVTLGIVRQSKREEVKVTIGESMLPADSSHAESALPQWQMPERFTQHRASPGDDTGWESFDSMTLKSLGDHRFQVEIRYLGTDGKLETHKFEGTREEIHSAVMSEKDLPANERSHLLNGLDLPNRESPTLGFHPMGPAGDFWNFAPTVRGF